METVVTKSYQGAQTRLLLPKVKDVAGVIGDNNSTRLCFKLPKIYETGWSKYIEFDCYVVRPEGEIKPTYALEADNSFLIPYEITEANVGKEVDYNLKFVTLDGEITEKSEIGTLYFRDSSNGQFTEEHPVIDILTYLYNNAFCDVSYKDGDSEGDQSLPVLTFTPMAPEGEPESIELNVPYLHNGIIPNRFIDKEIVVEINKISTPSALTDLTDAQVPDMALLSLADSSEPFYMDLYILIENDPTDIDNWYLIHTDNPTFKNVNIINDLSVTGNTDLSGTLEVTGETHLIDDVLIGDNDVQSPISSNLTVTGQTSTNTLNSGNTAINGTLDVTQQSQFNDNVTIGASNVPKILKTWGSTETTGVAKVDTIQSYTPDEEVNGGTVKTPVTINDDMVVANSATISGELVANDVAHFNDDIVQDTSKTTTLGTLNAQSTDVSSITAGVATVTNDATVNGTLYVDTIISKSANDTPVTISDDVIIGIQNNSLIVNGTTQSTGLITGENGLNITGTSTLQNTNIGTSGTSTQLHVFGPITGENGATITGDIVQTGSNTASFRTTTVDSLTTQGSITQTDTTQSAQLGVLSSKDTTIDGNITQSSSSGSRTAVLRDVTVDSLSTAGNITQTSPGTTSLQSTSITSLQSGNTNVSGTLGVTGATTLGSTLSVASDASFSTKITTPVVETPSILNSNGDTVTISDNLSVTGNESISGDLSVTGTTAVSSITSSGLATLNSLNVNGTTALKNGVDVTGITKTDMIQPHTPNSPITIDDNLSVAGTITQTDLTKTVTLGVLSAKATTVDSLSTPGDITQTDTTKTATLGPTTTKNATVDGTLTVTGTTSLKNTEVDDTLTVSSITGPNNNVSVSGDMSVSGIATFQSAPVLNTVSADNVLITDNAKNISGSLGNENEILTVVNNSGLKPGWQLPGGPVQNSDGVASRGALYTEQDSRIAGDTALDNAKAPNNHAVNANTYGLGTETNYGHVRFVTSVNSSRDTSVSQTLTVSEKAIVDFVNSSVEAVAAYYITRDLQGDVFTSVYDLRNTTPLYSAGVIRYPTRNDYAIVASDEEHSIYPEYGDYTTFTTKAQYVGYYVDYNNSKVLVSDDSSSPYYYNTVVTTPGTTIAYERINPTARYTYTKDGEGSQSTYDPTKWQYQYNFNQQYTDAQLKALNSGITNIKVQAYDTHISDNTKHVPLNQSSANQILVSGTSGTQAQWLTGNLNSADGLPLKLVDGILTPVSNTLATAVSPSTTTGTAVTSTEINIPYISANSQGIVTNLGTQKFTVQKFSTTQDGIVNKSQDASKILKGNNTWGAITDIDATLSWGQAVNIATIAGTNISAKLPANPDTHYQANIITGNTSSASSNSATSNPYLNLIENSTVRNSHQLKGTSNYLTVDSDANGAVIFDLASGVKTSLGYADTAVQSVNSKTGTSVILNGADVALTGYSKPSSTGAIATTDTINGAIGKLEKGLDGKLDKVTSASTYWRLYAIDTSGSQMVLRFNTTPTADDVPIFLSNGRLPVGTPQNNGDATTKLYVDTEDAKKVAYKTGTGVTYTADHIATFDDTTGKVIKDSGYTIATSVPSGAVFTDEKVKQSLTSNDMNLPILLSYGTTVNTSSNITQSCFRNNSIYANPSTGIITATGFAGNLSGTATYATGIGSTSTDIGNATTPVYVEDGVVKALGYTIATSVPSGALFTDQKVNQIPNSDNSNRPLLMGTTATGSQNGSTFKAQDKLYANPSTGTITAPHFYNSTTSSSLDFIVGSAFQLTEVD